jgi:hypothetical protein
VSLFSAITSALQSKWKLLGIIAVLQVGSHLPYMHLPPVGHHVWRQCNTLAVARNYAEEDMRIWLPRIDKRYHFPGTTGPSFTAYEYSLALIYRTIGFSHQAHRWFSLVLSLAGLAGFYFLVLSFKPHILLAGICTALLAAIPEFYYHSINAVPDLMALGLMLWGWLFARSWIRKRTWLSFTGASIFLALAGMVKLQFLVVGVPIAVECLNAGVFQSRRRSITASGMAAFVLVAAFLWYRHANFLTFQFWLNEFVHDVRLPDSMGSFFKILGVNLFRDLPGSWAGWALLPGLGYGMVCCFRQKAIRPFFIGTLAAAFMVYLFLQTQFWHHGYYTLFVAPFIALAAGYGYLRLLGEPRKEWLPVVVLLAFGWSWIRMQGNWQTSGWRVPAELVNSRYQSKILSTTDTAMRYIVGPDQSGCVYFYYLHAKGFPWYSEADKQADMAQWVRWGADGIITDRPELLSRNYSDSLSWEEVKQIGSFHWYRVRLKKP